MVSNKLLKAYNFESIDDYFGYIVVSKINGQHEQVLSLIKAMSKQQKKECLKYLEEFSHSKEDVKYCKMVLINNL